MYASGVCVLCVSVCVVVLCYETGRRVITQKCLWNVIRILNWMVLQSGLEKNHESQKSKNFFQKENNGNRLAYPQNAERNCHNLMNQLEPTYSANLTITFCPLRWRIVVVQRRDARCLLQAIMFGTVLELLCTNWAIECLLQPAQNCDRSEQRT